LCWPVLQALLPWVTGSFNAEEKEAMMDSLREATKNTMFDQWLDAVQSGSTAGNSSDTGTPRLAPAAAAGGSQAQGTPQQQHMDAHMQLAEIAEYLTDDGVHAGGCPAAAAAAGGSAGALSAAAVQHQHAQLLLQQQTELPGTVAESTNYVPGWEDIFNINQKQLEGAIRRVSNDPNLEPQRKAYLIQNIMVSRYIVAQQRRMRTQGSADPAGLSAAAAAAAAEGAGGGAGSCNRHVHVAGGGCCPHRGQYSHRMHAHGHHHQHFAAVVHQQQLLQPPPPMRPKLPVVMHTSAASAAAGGSSGGGGAAAAAVAAAGGVCHQTYTDATSGILGCKHYRRAARLVAPCCDQVFTCRCATHPTNVQATLLFCIDCMC
jgi:zinc finger-like protein